MTPPFYSDDPMGPDQPLHLQQYQERSLLALLSSVLAASTV